MKKLIRVLGVTLSLLVLASCTDENEGDGKSASDTVVTEANLKGVYTYVAVSVHNAVDLNKDGVFNNNLVKEGYETCTLDNQLVITETNYSYIMKGTSCGYGEKDLVFTYKLDKVANTITLYENGNDVGQISVLEYKKELDVKSYVFKVFDANLNQDVFYVMSGK